MNVRIRVPNPGGVFNICSDVVALVRAHAEALHQPAAMLATQHITRLLLGALGPEEMKVSFNAVELYSMNGVFSDVVIQWLNSTAMFVILHFQDCISMLIFAFIFLTHNEAALLLASDLHASLLLSTSHLLSLLTKVCYDSNTSMYV